MKWFKHQSSARNDERLARLEDKAGLEGYGFYFKMLEIVAEIVDETDRHEVTYSLSRWGRQANITSKKFIFLAQCCADVGLMIVQRCDNDCTIRIPNLLKYRDNHTKNLQATCKQELEVEIDKEVDKDLANNASELSDIPDLIDSNNQDEKIVSIKTNQKKKESPFPADFFVSEDMVKWAVKLGVSQDQLEPISLHFRDHHTARGNKFIDWNAAWRTWMRNSVGRFQVRK
ncbi:DUF4373 domain-containing protein [Nitrosovibrio sp. Nv6]|uniref:DUF4373 domain-containing protein n=1 Tax=Nitrosovibrio sp. Nv6 TaxID=1855340 RepID=UPI0008CBD2D8|nr:DUF4373 domain-containing protein [Nitrosovibrio sp. Nv6]SEO78577.1 protein of unknown function [Nitrosovibrio sp. Nv6]